MRRALGFLVTGCVCVADPIGQDFPCSVKSDCAEGYDCVSGHCASPSGGGGGSQDSGAGGGGTANGGAGGGTAHETNCSNLIDDDGDGFTDCADSDCASQHCSTLSTASICCGTSCIDTAQNPLNCGGCGLACATGQLCTSLTTGTAITGTCGCFATSCPRTQSCFNDAYCTCSSQADCAAGEVCDTGGGHGACRYP
jgi:hypothetical protein